MVSWEQACMRATWDLDRTAVLTASQPIRLVPWTVVLRCERNAHLWDPTGESALKRKTKNISFILVSKYKLLLSREPLSFIFDYLPSAYSITHNCGTTWRFWLSNLVVPTFVRTVKHFNISIYTPIINTHIYSSPNLNCFLKRSSPSVLLLLPLISSIFSLQICLPLQTSSFFWAQIPYENPVHCLPWRVTLWYLSVSCYYKRTLWFPTILTTVPDGDWWTFLGIAPVPSSFILFVCSFVDGMLLIICCQSPTLYLALSSLLLWIVTLY